MKKRKPSLSHYLLLFSAGILLAACSTTTATKPSQTASSSEPSQSKQSSSVATSTSSSTSVASSSQEVPARQDTPAMDIQAVAQGDYSSIVGTWQNAEGNTLVFDENGLVGEAQLTNTGGRLDLVEGAVVLSAGIPDADAGGFGIVIVPQGVKIAAGNLSGTEDTSDSTQDRMFAGQQFVLDANGVQNAIYYRVPAE